MYKEILISIRKWQRKNTYSIYKTLWMLFSFFIMILIVYVLIILLAGQISYQTKHGATWVTDLASDVYPNLVAGIIESVSMGIAIAMMLETILHLRSKIDLYERAQVNRDRIYKVLFITEKAFKNKDTPISWTTEEKTRLTEILTKCNQYLTIYRVAPLTEDDQNQIDELIDVILPTSVNNNLYSRVYASFVYEKIQKTKEYFDEHTSDAVKKYMIELESKREGSAGSSKTLLDHI
ncbi:MAG: hypothetical protein V1644_03080 [Candidatus Micrarchaeota archaeon]